ncbi:MAG: anaerobic ribonucleoside-triphosphate reductase activating protein [Muribaculaceae bacterium]|nr:anaerobic ribonucleoside-triphosphate reductase activating protein [Muribaculaceae bacterium]
MSMYYSAIKPFDIANGPGIRVSLFVSGCPHHCKNCFNPETWDYLFGEEFGYCETQKIIDLLKEPGISGLTILGGEPMVPRNVEYVAQLIADVRKTLPDKSIWIYTGYTIEEIFDRWALCCTSYSMLECQATMAILRYADVLVDGRFVEDLKDLKLRFRGSSNQRIIDLKKSKFTFPTKLDEPFRIDELVLAEEYM